MIASGNMIQVALAIIGRPDGSARDLEQMFDRKDRNCILIERTLKGEMSYKQFEACSNCPVWPPTGAVSYASIKLWKTC